jgi:peptide/nickel transport system permease protein
MSALSAGKTQTLASERPSSTWKWIRVWLSHRSVLIGMIALSLLFFLAIFANVLSPYPPNSLDTSRILSSPNLDNIFGTDHFGRDVFSRVSFGARISLGVGFMVITVTGVAGSIVGLISGYVRWVDNVLMRFMDILMAFPGFILAIGIMAILGPRLSNVVVALSIVYTPLVARVIRGTTLQLRELQYVEAARAIGGTNIRILARHIFPNCVAPLTVQLTVIFAYAVLAEAGLSFIGAGVPPEVPSWGIVLSEGRDYLQTAPWIALFAGTSITITVLAVNLLGDGLRDVTDPHLRHR